MRPARLSGQNRQVHPNCVAVDAILADLERPMAGWYWLPDCSLYGLKEAETKCIDEVARDERGGSDRDGRWQQRDPSRERRVATHLLEVERVDEQET